MSRIIDRSVPFGDRDTFTLTALSPFATKERKGKSESVDIRVTGDINDVSQKNFEILVQTISMITTPYWDEPPVATEKMSIFYHKFKGEGFVWCFHIESVDSFTKINEDGTEDQTAVFNDVLNNILLPNGCVLNYGKNIHVKKTMRAR